MVRHPLKRLESDWKMRRREGWAEEDVNDAVAKRSSSLLRRSGVVDVARKLAPAPVFELSKGLLTRDAHYEATWDPGVRRLLWEDEFAEESRLLLRDLGKPDDFWAAPDGP
jgi:hypothetical protein